MRQAVGMRMQDDATPYYQKIKDADAVVIGSPIYAGSITLLLQVSSSVFLDIATLVWPCKITLYLGHRRIPHDRCAHRANPAEA